MFRLTNHSKLNILRHLKCEIENYVEKGIFIDDYSSVKNLQERISHLDSGSRAAIRECIRVKSLPTSEDCLLSVMQNSLTHLQRSSLAGLVIGAVSYGYSSRLALAALTSCTATGLLFIGLAEYNLRQEQLNSVTRIERFKTIFAIDELQLGLYRLKR